MRLQPALERLARAPEPAGLTSERACRRLAEAGPNTLPDAAPHALRRAFGKLWAPVPWMLELAVALQLAMGAYGEAGAVLALLLFNAALGFVQEGRAQATLDTLKSRLALVATVQRDAARERRHLWSSRPGPWLVSSSAIDVMLFATLATRGLLLAPLPIPVVAGLAAAACLFAFVLDSAKLVLFKRCGVA